MCHSHYWLLCPRSTCCFCGWMVSIHLQAPKGCIKIISKFMVENTWCNLQSWPFLIHKVLKIVTLRMGNLASVGWVQYLVLDIILASNRCSRYRCKWKEEKGNGMSWGNGSTRWDAYWGYFTLEGCCKPVLYSEPALQWMEVQSSPENHSLKSSIYQKYNHS